MKRQTVVRTLPEALKVIKEINLTSQDEWAGDYRDAARETIARVPKDRMEERVAGHLSWAYDKGNPPAHYQRQLSILFGSSPIMRGNKIRKVVQRLLITSLRDTGQKNTPYIS